MAYNEDHWKKWNSIQLQMLFAMILLKGLIYNKKVTAIF
jgi:hypothetical protein